MKRGFAASFLAVAIASPLQGISEEIDYDALSLGVRVVSLEDTRQVFKENDVKLPRRDGVLILDVFPYGPAHVAGARAGDLVVSINGQTVRQPDEFRERVSGLDAKRPAELLASRLVTLRGRQTWKTASPKVRPAPLREVLTAGLAEEEDKVGGGRFFQHKDSPGTVNSSSEVYAYIAESDGRHSLRLKVQYVADDWLFIEKLTFKVGEETFAIAPGFLEFERDNGARGIWEWCDLPVSEDRVAMLEKVASEPGEVILRLEGSTYRKDRTLPDAEKQRLAMVLMAYAMMRQEAGKP